MKVLHVMFGNGFAGGSAFSMVSLAAGLKKLKGIEVIAVVPWERKHILAQYLRARNIKVYELAIPRMVIDALNGDRPNSIQFRLKRAVKYTARFLSDLVVDKIIRKQDIDLVHIGDAVIDVGAAPAFHLGVPVVWHFREYGDLDWGLSFFNEKKAFDNFERAEACIAVSHSVESYYKSKCEAIRTHVVYNGIIPESEEIQPFFRRKDLASFKVAFFGGIRNNKGIFDLLDAICLICRNNFRFRSDIHLDIYGGANDRDYKKFIRLIESEHLSDMISYKGWVDINLQTYQNYDVSVVASKCEAFGRVTAESQLAGVLVIGSDTGGTKELLKNGRGLLYEEGNIGDLADKLVWAWRNEAACRQIEEEAFTFACENYSIASYVSSVEKIYRDCLQ